MFITGDMHGDIDKLAAAVKHAQQNANGQAATLIVAGDFGIFRSQQEAESSLKWVKNTGVVVGFIDGNHDNHHLLNQLPVSAWNGGQVHMLAPNVFHLMRGEIYEVEGKRLFCFGGASSLDKIRRLRFERETGEQIWWPEEIPSRDQIEAGRAALLRTEHIDFIITHTAPEKVQKIMGYIPIIAEMELAKFFDWVSESVQFKHWIFGHFHQDCSLARFTCIYNDILEL